MTQPAERPPPLCCARLPDGGWCVLPDKHGEDVACIGVPARHGPQLPLDRKLMRRELWDPNWDPVTRRPKEPR
jgi:hypothetical protein